MRESGWVSPPRPPDTSELHEALTDYAIFLATMSLTVTLIYYGLPWSWAAWSP